MQVIALIILALPLFLLPAMLKFSAGLLGRIYNGARGAMDKYGGSQLDGFRKNRVKEMYGNSRLKAGLEHRKSMRGYRATLRHGKGSAGINRLLGGKTYVDSARRKAAALEKNEDLDAIKEADAQQSHLGNAGELDMRKNRLDIATGRTKTYLDKDGNEKQVTRYAQIAAAQKLLESGNFAERSAIYDSITPESDQLLRETVSQLYFKKGDTAAMTPKYGGQLLAGTSGGTEGRLKSVAERIQNGQITPSAMVHDAQATEDILTVASGRKYKYDEDGAIMRDEKKNAIYEEGVTVDYGLSQERITGLMRVAEASLTNEETAQKAIAPTYYDKIKAVTTLSPGGGVASSSQSQNGADITIQPQVSIQPNVTRGMTPSDVAQLSPQQVQMSVQNGGGAANLNQADLNTIYSAMNQSGKDYGDLSRQIQQAMDRASAANSPAAPPPIPASQQTTQTDASGRQTPGSVNDPDEYRRRFGG